MILTAEHRDEANKSDDMFYWREAEGTMRQLEWSDRSREVDKKNSLHLTIRLLDQTVRFTNIYEGIMLKNNNKISVQQNFETSLEIIKKS